MMMLTFTEKDFENLYSKLGLIDGQGEKLTLHSNCKYCDDCWKEMQEKKPPDDGFWTVTRPWVGKNYGILRLLVIGINMNHYGGYNGAIDLVETAKSELKKGKIKHFISKDYSGTLFFHRMASYAAAFLAQKRISEEIVSQSSLSTPQNLVSVFDYIAYTNQVKCSPHDCDPEKSDKSKPSSQMWDNCGKFILRPEIDLLKPDQLLFLGTENFRKFNENVLDESIDLDSKNEVQFGEGKINNKAVKIYVVKHPAANGGSNQNIIDGLYNLLNPVSQASFFDAVVTEEIIQKYQLRTYPWCMSTPFSGRRLIDGQGRPLCKMTENW